MLKQSRIEKLDHKDDLTAEKMYAVFQRSYRKEAELIGVKDFPPLRRHVKDLQKSETVFFGYWKSGFLAAVIELVRQETQLEICSLVVDPEYFRQGIASELLYFVLSSSDYETAVVETALANKPAIRLYEKSGFIAEKRWVSSHGIPKIMLRLKATAKETLIP